LAAEKKRLANFEALRSVAMLLIVICHFCNFALLPRGFSSRGFGLLNFLVADALLVVCCVGVNVFVLISAYFLVHKELNFRRILRIWLQVLFYSTLISAIGWMIGKEPFTARNLFQAFFPVLNGRYWFVGPYIGLALLAPFLSKTVMALTKKEYQWLLVILTCICCTFTSGIPYGNRLGANNGYSLIWFIALFFTGGYFRRFDPIQSKRTIGLAFLLLAGVVYLFYIGKAFWRYKTSGNLSLEFSSYNSFAYPLAVLAFLFFQKLPDNGSRIISLLARPAAMTFGIYLIHEHPIVREWLWQNGWGWTGLDNDSPWLIPCGLLYCSIIFLVCCGIDRGRLILFKALTPKHSSSSNQ
jgi:surface polysaccharide O-acyltransferase-like enzyme